MARCRWSSQPAGAEGPAQDERGRDAPEVQSVRTSPVANPPHPCRQGARRPTPREGERAYRRGGIISNRSARPTSRPGGATKRPRALRRPGRSDRAVVSRFSLRPHRSHESREPRASTVCAQRPRPGDWGRSHQTKSRGWCQAPSLHTPTKQHALIQNRKRKKQPTTSRQTTTPKGSTTG